MNNSFKKSEAGLVAILIIIIAFFFLGWLINVSQRECRSNKDCGSEAYCGSDFSCHSFPIIQKTVVQYSLFLPAVIIGIAIVLAAWILKDVHTAKEESKNAAQENKINAKIPEEVEDISGPYYKSDSNVRTP